MTAAYTRFRNRVTEAEDGSECWLWNGALSFFSEDEQRMISPRRWIWAYVHGERVPENRIVRASCDVKRCVLPEHLYLVAKGRRSRTHCWRGHRMDESNGYWTASGSWVCRPCQRDHQRRARQSEEYRQKQRDYSADYLRRNRRQINARRRRRYAEDPQYRARQQETARRWRAGKAQEGDS